MSLSHVLTEQPTCSQQGAETGGSGTLHRRTEASRGLDVPASSLPECLWGERSCM